MANLFARASANWASANWNTAADGSGSSVTPGATDVCMSNGFTVNINTNITVAECRSDTTGGATTGGGFSFTTNGVTLTANCYGGGSTPGNGNFFCSLASPNAVSIVGNVTAGTGAACHGVYMSGTGTFNITGDVYGNSLASARGVHNHSTGTVNITGTVYGGAASPGVYNNGAGTITITGNAVANTTAAQSGAFNASTGTVTISGYAQSNDYGPGSAGISAGYGVTNSGQGVVEIGEARSGAKGLPAVSGAFRYASTTAAKSTVRATSGLTSVALRPVAAVVPAVTDVKSGVVYGDSGYTGTLVSTSTGSKKTNMSAAMG